MTAEAKPSFEIRAAQMREAATICEVLRRSIVELCERDHRNDPVRLAEWLAYKTPEHVARWIADPGSCMFVADSGDWRATLSRQGNGTQVELDWQVTVAMPLIRYLSPVLKPLFAWNHYWTTPRGEAGMMRFLAQQYPHPAATPIPKGGRV